MACIFYLIATTIDKDEPHNWLQVLQKQQANCTHSKLINHINYLFTECISHTTYTSGHLFYTFFNLLIILHITGKSPYLPFFTYYRCLKNR